MSRPLFQRRWNLGDLLVLRTLALNGETLAGLAFRLRRPFKTIVTKCHELQLPVSGSFLQNKDRP